MLEEFKVLAMRGNLLDMAEGIVLVAAFDGIVTSFVSDNIVLPIGLLGRRPLTSSCPRD